MDTTQLPTDLRGFLEAAKTAGKLHNELPDALRNLPMSELMALTPEDIQKILTPPEKPADTNNDDKPKDEK